MLTIFANSIFIFAFDCDVCARVRACMRSNTLMICRRQHKLHVMSLTSECVQKINKISLK